jgi:hypothetical protein
MFFAIVLMAYIQVQKIFYFFVHRMKYYDIINPKYRACVDRPGSLVTTLQHMCKQKNIKN